MRVRIMFLALAGLVVLGLLPGAVSAAGRVRQYGPFPSSSPDSGTCGNDWANDTFDRHFKVDTQPNVDGTYTIVQEFKKGSFVTMAGASPGACETNPGGTVAAGVSGKMHGTFTIVVSGGTYNPSGNCPAVCTTAAFVQAVFGAAATYDVPTFEFHYSAGNNGEWKNASADRGGNHGDITGSP
ncbi:MAG: hypothetical protein IT304_04950 [Dehalococcoidia bacterium]|nr:hypothetical protein [Dehalococcoidia bacterium]